MADNWEPVLHGGLADRARLRVAEVAQALDPWRIDAIERAEWGVPLLDAYGHLCRGYSPGYETTVAAAAAAGALETARTPWLFGRGWAGTGWLAAHLQRLQGEASYDWSDVIDGLDDLLQVRPWHFQYDLISGYVGIAVFLDEIAPVAPERVRRSYGLILQLIEETAIRHQDGTTTWHTGAALLPDWQRELAPEGYYNLGVAHGVPGVLWTLARAKRLGVDTERSNGMLDGGVRWLLKQRGENGLFASWIPRSAPSRVGGFSWCYGGLGVALALLSIACDVDRDDWRAAAIDIGRFEAARAVALSDAGICHGMAGAAHLLNRLFQQTGIKQFRDAALSWLSQTVEFRAPSGNGIGGYSSWTSESGPSRNFVWKDDATFLTGAPGTALVLIAASSNVEPQWDRVLLLPQSTWP